jgi:protein-tyrosine phosphatase
MQETKDMLSKAYDEGVRILVLTPHNYPGEEYDIDKIKKAYEEVVAEANCMFDDMTLILGNEIFYRDGVISELKAKKALTLGDTSYVLVEFDVRLEFPKMYQAVRKLIEAGYRPIIAHMERYECLYKQYVRVQELIELGACMQMNCRSVMGGLLDSRAAYCRKLIEKNLIHFLGSDCHNMTSRPPQMNTCVESLRKKISQSIIDKITVSNVERFLLNRYIDN